MNARRGKKDAGKNRGAMKAGNVPWVLETVKMDGLPVCWLHDPKEAPSVLKSVCQVVNSDDSNVEKLL